MRKWVIIGLAVLAIALVIGSNLVSSLTLSDLASRPVLALTRDETRIPVQQSGRPAAEGEARILSGTGTLLGYRLLFQLPNGEAVECAVRYRSMRCTDRWMAERSG